MAKGKTTRRHPYSRDKFSVVLIQDGEEKVYPLKRKIFAEVLKIETLKYVIRNSRLSNSSTILRRYAYLTPEKSAAELSRLLSTYDPPILPPGTRLDSRKKKTTLLKALKTKDKNSI